MVLFSELAAIVLPIFITAGIGMIGLPGIAKATGAMRAGTKDG